jgi:hypothetical protein
LKIRSEDLKDELVAAVEAAEPSSLAAVNWKYGPVVLVGQLSKLNLQMKI